MSELEQAILKTLIYSDLFDFPLRQTEIHKYLVSYKATITNLEEGLKKLIRSHQVGEKDGYYYLAGREQSVPLRQNRADISRKKIEFAKKKLRILKWIPWLCFVGITGTVAVENANEEDDIDLLLIFQSNRMYLGRLLEYVLLTLIRHRRRAGQVKVRDLFCPNLYLSEAALGMKRQDLFTAHELVQIFPIWERKDTYARLLNANQWIKDYFPNYSLPVQKRIAPAKPAFFLLTVLEHLVARLQWVYMLPKRKREIVTWDQLFFHPKDVRTTILSQYEERVQRYFQ